MATDAPASECWLLDAGLPGAVSHVAAGRFRGQGSLDVALVSARHVQLLGDAPGHGPRRRLERVCVHPVHAPIRDAKTVPHSQADQDLLALLVAPGTLLLLRFHQEWARLAVVQRASLSAAPHPSHLGHLLAASPDGCALAVAACERRVAVLPLDTADGGGGGGMRIGAPALFTGAGNAAPVAGARPLPVASGGGGNSGAGCPGEGTGAVAETGGGLGSIWDIAFLDTPAAGGGVGAGAGGGGSLAPSRVARAGGSRAPSPAQHLVVLTHRKGELSSELLLLRWARAGGGAAAGALQQLLSVAAPHGGRGALVGVPCGLAPVPGSPSGLVVIGDRGLAALDLGGASGAPGAFRLLQEQHQQTLRQFEEQEQEQQQQQDQEQEQEQEQEHQQQDLGLNGAVERCSRTSLALLAQAVAGSSHDMLFAPTGPPREVAAALPALVPLESSPFAAPGVSIADGWDAPPPGSMLAWRAHARPDEEGREREQQPSAAPPGSMAWAWLPPLLLPDCPVSAADAAADAIAALDPPCGSPMQLDGPPSPPPPQQQLPSRGVERQLLVCRAAGNLEVFSFPAIESEAAGSRAGGDAGAAERVLGSLVEVHQSRAVLAAVAALPQGRLLAVQRSGDALLLSQPPSTPLLQQQPGCVLAERERSRPLSPPAAAAPAAPLSDGPSSVDRARRGAPAAPAAGWDYSPARVDSDADMDPRGSATPASPMQRDTPPAWTPPPDMPLTQLMATTPLACHAPDGAAPAAPPSPQRAARRARAAHERAPAPEQARARRRLPLLQRLQQPAPLADLVAWDFFGEGTPQVFSASARPQGGLQTLRAAAPAPLLAAGPPGMLCGVTGLWRAAASPPVVVLSSAGGSRAMAALAPRGAAAPGGERPAPRAGAAAPAGAAVTLVDATDALGLCAAEPTLFAGAVGDGAVVQVTPRGAYLCSLEGLPGCAGEEGAGGGVAGRRGSPKGSRGSGSGGEAAPAPGSRGPGGGSPLRGPRAGCGARGRSPLMPAPARAPRRQQAPSPGAAGGLGEPPLMTAGLDAAGPDDMSEGTPGPASACDMDQDDDASSSSPKAPPAGPQPQPSPAAPPCWAGSHWAAPPGQSVALAAAAAGLVATYLAPCHELRLVSAAAEGAAAGAGGPRGGGAGGAAGHALSPSRKRGRAGWRLREAWRSGPLGGAQLSCVHVAPAPAADDAAAAAPAAAHGGGALRRWWLLAGRYDGSVEVSVVGERCARVSRLALLGPDELRSGAAPTSGAAAPTSGSPPPAAGMHRSAGGSVPQSLVALPAGLFGEDLSGAACGGSGGNGLVFLASFKDGSICLYDLTPPPPPPAMQQQQQQQQQQPPPPVPAAGWRLRLLWRVQAGGAPVQLVPCGVEGGFGSAAVSAPQHKLLAVGEHTWVLTVQPADRVMRLQQLALPGALHAVPLPLPLPLPPPQPAPAAADAGGRGAAPPPALALLFARGDGGLALARPELAGAPHVRHSLQGLALRRLVVLADSGQLAALGGPAPGALDAAAAAAAAAPACFAAADGDGHKQHRRHHGRHGQPAPGWWAPPVEGVHVIDPVEGGLLCSWALKPGEKGVCACPWLPEGPPRPPHGAGSRASSASGGSSGGAEPGAAGAAGAATGPAGTAADGAQGLFHFPDLLKRFREGLASPRRAHGHGPWRLPSPGGRRQQPDQAPDGAAASGSAAAAGATPDSGGGGRCAGQRGHERLCPAAGRGPTLLVVGTVSEAAAARRQARAEGGGSQSPEPQEADDDDAEGGRVCVLQLMHWSHQPVAACDRDRDRGGGVAGGAWVLRLVSSLRMPFGVSAVAALDGRRLIVGVGGFLAAYGPAEGRRLRQLGAAAARAPIVSLAVSRSSSGGGGSGGDGEGAGAWLVAAADRAQGLVVYRVERQMRRRPPSEAAGEQEQEQEEQAVTLQALWAHEEVRPLLQVRPLPQQAPLRGGRWLCLDARGCLLEVGGTPHAATAPAAGAGAGAAARRRRADGGSERLPLAGRTLRTLAELPVGAGPRFALVACDGRGGSGCGAGATWYVVSCGPDGGLLRAAPLPPADAAALLSLSTGDAEGGASGGPAAVRLGRRLVALGAPAHPLCAPCGVAAAMVGDGVREALMRAPFDGLI